MAADLPEMRHENAVVMAKALVTYMDDVSAIRRAIKLEFERAPDASTIKRLRKRHLASLERSTPAFKPHEGYYPLEASRNADWSNRAFVSILKREHPDRFTDQQLVNMAWDDAMQVPA